MYANVVSSLYRRTADDNGDNMTIQLKSVIYNLIDGLLFHLEEIIIEIP